jgi:ribonuclease G
MLQRLVPPDERGGYIIRTSAEDATEADLASDLEYLRVLWGRIQERRAESPAPAVLYQELWLAQRILRDVTTEATASVQIDSRENFLKLEQFARQFVPRVESKLSHYTGERPLFDLHSIDAEIERALARRVELKSGGYLIIDQTEAMTTVDVNTGGFVGTRNFDDTIYKTNLEAAHAIARQLRLRNLGGIIIVDFIDMTQEDHKRQVLRAFEKYLEKDYAKTHISEVSTLGLVEMTRKRTRESLEHILCEECPTCGGRASLKTPETVCYEIFREILRESRQYDAQQLLVLASQEVVDLLLDEESDSLAELEAFIGKPIKFQVEALYTQEQYDVVPR